MSRVAAAALWGLAVGYSDDDLLPISALQHLLYCRRQCALIHMEQAWAENRLTAQGRRLHDRAHQAGPESRGQVRIVRGLRLCSRVLGLAGQADVVELHRAAPDTPAEEQACFPGLDGRWRAVPVEYKRGRPKTIDCDRVQLCAQAMCLEEMVGLRIPIGALFYGRPRRREVVQLDDELRQLVIRSARELRELLESAQVPPAPEASKCRNCSLVEQCMPRAAGRLRPASAYLAAQIRESLASPAPETPDANA